MKKIFVLILSVWANLLIAASIDVPASSQDEKSSRIWTRQADLDLSGRSGTSTTSGLSVGFQFVGTNETSDFKGSFRLVRQSDRGEVSADNFHAKLSYETKPVQASFGYVRTDTGYDRAQHIDFLSVNAAGLGLRLLTTEKGKLDGLLGLAHRTERYSDLGNTDISAPSADLGVIYQEDFGWTGLDISVSLVPVLENLSDYIVHQETTLSLLRNAGPFSLKVGIANDYRSKPQLNQVSTDTAYFVRLAYVWK
jgi:putative salt-induced outer membrane protein YdiY